MSYWRSEYDDGWWTFYKDGIEIKLDNLNFGDLIVDEINNANQRIAELESKQRWIPISSGRLPNKFQECIVLDSGGHVHNWMHDDALLPLFAQYTHWMPLPEPPEGS